MVRGQSGGKPLPKGFRAFCRNRDGHPVPLSALYPPPQSETGETMQGLDGSTGAESLI
jgi:hypothetical protein